MDYPRADSKALSRQQRQGPEAAEVLRPMFSREAKLYTVRRAGDITGCAHGYRLILKGPPHRHTCTGSVTEPHTH